MTQTRADAQQALGGGESSPLNLIHTNNSPKSLSMRVCGVFHRSWHLSGKTRREPTQQDANGFFQAFLLIFNKKIRHRECVCLGLVRSSPAG